MAKRATLASIVRVASDEEVALLDRLRIARSNDPELARELQVEYDTKFAVLDKDYARKMGYSPPCRVNHAPNGYQPMSDEMTAQDTGAAAPAKGKKTGGKVNGAAKAAAAPKAAKEKAPKAPKEAKAKLIAKLDPKTRIAFGTNAEGKAYDTNKNNPKRAGSKSFDTFAKYKSNMTLEQAVAAGIPVADISWDLKHGFIVAKKDA